MSAIIAIDPGMRTGIAWVDGGGSIEYTTWHLHRDRSQRLVDLTRRLSDLNSKASFCQVGYEEPFQGPYINAVRSLYHLEGAIMQWACTAGIPVLGYTPKEIKASVAGGRANKARMMNVMRWLGYAPEDDHQADALALLRLMMAGVKPIVDERKEAVRITKKRTKDLFK